MAVCHCHGKNELTKRIVQQECRGTAENRLGEERGRRRRIGKRENKRRRKQREYGGGGGGGGEVRLSKQNQMQECGGPFDLCPHRLIDVAHFISLSES